MTTEILKAALAAADMGKDAFEKFKKKVPNIIDVIKKHVIRTCLWFLASFLISAPILFAGIFLEIKTLVILAGIIRAAATIVFRVMLAPVEIILGMMQGGISGVLRRYINSLSGLFIAELVLVAVIAWLPLKNNPDMIVMFILLSMIISVLAAPVFTRKVSVVVVTMLFVLTTLSFFKPYSIQSFGKVIRDSDMEAGMPKRIDREMTCSGFERGEYKFFGDDGAILKYYYQNQKTHELEAYSLMSKNITHAKTGEELKPFSKEKVEELENQICQKEERAKEKAEKLAKEAEQKKIQEEQQNAEADPLTKDYTGKYKICLGEPCSDFNIIYTNNKISGESNYNNGDVLVLDGYETASGDFKGTIRKSSKWGNTEWTFSNLKLEGYWVGRFTDQYGNTGSIVVNKI